jgi:hypothetical protein
MSSGLTDTYFEITAISSCCKAGRKSGVLVAAIAFVGNDQLQAFLGNGCRFGLVAEDEGEQGHPHFPPNSRLNRPGFS